MMDTIPISEFKATCLSLLDTVKKTGHPLIITRKGEPIAQIIPPPPSIKLESWLGSFKLSGTIEEDLISPATDAQEWEALNNKTAS